MEKKQEKEIEIKLRAESDSPGSAEETRPELIPAAEGCVDDTMLPDAPVSAPESAPALVPEPAPASVPEPASASVPEPATSEPGKEPATAGASVQEPQSSTADKGTASFKLTSRYVLIGLSLLLLAGSLAQAWSWYVLAPRPDRAAAHFMTPALLAGLVGDPDAAYAIQMMPVMISDVSIGDKHQIGAMDVPELQKLNSFEALQQFIAHSSGDKSLSTLAMSTTFSARGKAADAVRTVRPLIDSTGNPIMKGYLAMLLCLNNDLPGALTELDKGLSAAKTGKMWTDSSSIRALALMKAAVLRAMGQPEAALNYLDSEFSKDYKNYSYYADEMRSAKAAALIHLGQYDKAIALACQAKELNRMVLSTAYLMKGDYNEALTQAGDCYLALSRIYSQQGTLGEALKYAEKADAGIDSITTREQRVFVLNQMKRYKEALALSANLTEYAKLRNGSGSLEAMVQIHADRAFAFAQLGDARNAIIEANLALANNPYCRRALEAARLANMKTGDLAKAAEYENRLKQLESIFDIRPIAFSSLNKR